MRSPPLLFTVWSAADAGCDTMKCTACRAAIFAEIAGASDEDRRSWPGWVVQNGRLMVQAVFLKALLLQRALNGGRPPTYLKLFTSHEAEVSDLPSSSSCAAANGSEHQAGLLILWTHPIDVDAEYRPEMMASMCTCGA